MDKPRGVRWLEEQTAQHIDMGDTGSESGRDRHISVRVPRAMATELEALAGQRGISVSALVRDTVESYLREQRATTHLEVQALVDRLVEDATEVRRRLAG